MTPFGSRVGIGAIGAGLAAASGAVPLGALVALVAAGTTAAALLDLKRDGAGSAHRASVGVLAGAWLVIFRLAFAPVGPGAPPFLPSGAGPWTARVTAMAAPRDGQQRLTVVLDEPFGAFLAVTAPRYPPVEPGDQVRFAGRPTPPPEGGYGEFLRRTGIAGTLRAATLEVVAHAGDAAGLLERTRRAAGDSLTRALPEPAAGLAAGILVGLRDRVDRDLAAAFTATGLSHVVAISGWNIALVAGLVGAVLAGRTRRTRSGGILVAIVLYTVLAGASASVVRAAAMTGVALLARETGRPGTAAAALGWAVAVLVIANPASAVDVGLQLSAAATAGLIAWSRPIGAVLDRRVGWVPGWIREGLAVSLAAQAATLPLVLVAFGRVAPLSPITNLAVVPLVPLAMATGALALAGGALAALGGPGIVASILGIPGALVFGLLIGDRPARGHTAAGQRHPAAGSRGDRGGDRGRGARRDRRPAEDPARVGGAPDAAGRVAGRRSARGGATDRPGGRPWSRRPAPWRPACPATREPGESSGSPASSGRSPSPSSSSPAPRARTAEPTWSSSTSGRATRSS